ncbi:MAG: FixH family protein [Rhizobiaceae bacterium]|nr:FixH family protein [Rhizobiaceae bacterium]
MRNQWRLTIGVALLVALVAIGLFASRHLSEREPEADLARSKPSAKGIFVVSIKPDGPEPSVGPIATWDLALTRPDGTPVSGAAVTVGGGMPQHNHGFPTEPRVSAAADPGRYRIEGVKFSMPGLWEMRLTISAGTDTDEALFNIRL